MLKLLVKEMESLNGGVDPLLMYCKSIHGFNDEDARLCYAELKSGEQASGTHLFVDPLIVGCAAGGILSILLGVLNPVLGRIASIGVLAGCTIAKLGSSS